MTHLTQKIIFILLGVLLLSCTKPIQSEVPGTTPEQGQELVTVLFSASGNRKTKVTAVSDAEECAIGRWSVFAFENGSGHVRWESSADGTPLPLQLIAGRSYTCYAIVNYPITGTGAFDPSSIRNSGDLTDKIAYLGDNLKSALLMFGGTVITPVADATENVTINVRRLVSRIDLRGLQVDFSGKPGLESKTFTLRGVYVTNAYRTTRYGDDYTFPELSPTRSAWYNSGGWHRGESPVQSIDVLLGDRDINTVVSAGFPYTVNHSFYTFPNPTELADDIRTMTSWTRRCTRLVIEASIGSDIVYYAITVPAMVRNRIYAASNVVIRGRGSNDPEEIDIDPEIVLASVEPVIDDSWDGAGTVLLD